MAHTITPEVKVDGWSVALLVILFLPWLRTVFESIDFPGGGSVKFRREVKAEQERQAKEIEAMWFLLGRFLQKPERELLQRLDKGEEVRVTDGPGDRLFHQVDSLRRTGMIALKPGLREKYQQLSTTTGQTSMDLTIVGDLYEISDAGRKYLELIATLPDDIEQSYPDPSELRTGPSTPSL
ncbi:hypothetical protein BST43_23400 [Mycobacteroides saopaulense]|uniref:Uncharacterized protein n=1 Tax=Mycobacteroides saopaulense TaxID=1578165 RepID=A0A1X0IN06_9MYCO|nr:hypothetical protein BST43_23400 [Mycobacteroides saopaulense]